MSQIDNFDKIDTSIIVNLQMKLDLQQKENLNYINVISDQRQEIENLKSKIEFLERIVNLEKNNKDNNKENNKENKEGEIKEKNTSIIRSMIKWIY